MPRGCSKGGTAAHVKYTLCILYVNVGTLHVIIIPGGVQMWGFCFGTPRGSQTWDGAIPMHGNGRYGYYKNLFFRSKIEKCKQFSPATVFWTSVGFPPPGQPSRQDETTPRGRFVNFTLRGLLWHLEYLTWLIVSRINYGYRYRLPLPQ